ncbi:Hypothetical predicted protein, partial [Mytilus galloprovincialis]
ILESKLTIRVHITLRAFPIHSYLVVVLFIRPLLFGIAGTITINVYKINDVRIKPLLFD